MHYLVLVGCIIVFVVLIELYEVLKKSYIILTILQVNESGKR